MLSPQVFICAALVLLGVAHGQVHHPGHFAPTNPEQTEMCMKESGATREMMAKHRPGDENIDKEILCFIKCQFEKSGFLKDGMLDVEKMKQAPKVAGEQRRVEMIECLEKVDKIESCDHMSKLTKCFKIAHPQ